MPASTASTNTTWMTRQSLRRPPGAALGPGSLSIRDGAAVVAGLRFVAGPTQLVNASPQLAHLGALTGDLLAQQSGGEHEEAEDHAGLDDGPDPALTDALEPEPAERQHPGQDAEEADERAEHPEQQQRLLAEAQLEPHRQHVEHADRNAVPGGELRLAGVPRVERDRDLVDLISLRMREHDHVAVPVRAHGELVHDLAPVRLDGVQILHPHVEQRAAQPVVDVRNERLLVDAFFEPRDHVRLVRQNWPDQTRDVLRLELEVGRVEDEHVAACGEVARPQRVSDAAARAVAREPEERVPRDELLEHRPGRILRAVVDDDDLEADVGRGAEDGVRLLHEERQVLRLVLGGHQHAHVHLLARLAPPGSGERRHRNGADGHTRLRIRAERTPSWSRYFATVRLAICTPLSFRMFTIAWSVSGCFGSSFSTSFWIWSLMPRADTSSPAVVLSPEEKKNLSGSTPRGVWTNFSFVTRLTVDSCMLITSATSRRVSGLRCCTPFSKKSRCRSTM